MKTARWVVGKMVSIRFRWRVVGELQNFRRQHRQRGVSIRFRWRVVGEREGKKEKCWVLVNCFNPLSLESGWRERRKIANTLGEGKQYPERNPSLSKHNFQLFFEERWESIVLSIVLRFGGQLMAQWHDVHTVAWLHRAVLEDLAQGESQAHQIFFAHVRGHENGFLYPMATVFFECFDRAVA